MALARGRRSEAGFNYWPGFVDALSTLVLSIVFLLSVFLVVQFFLSQEVTGKDKALEQLNAKLAQLNDLLSLEKLGKLNLDDQLSQMRAGLASAEAERDRVKGLYDGLAGAGSDAAGRASELNKALDSEKQIIVARAGADRGAEPADQRAAPPTRRAGGSARRFGKARQGIAGADRRPRAAAQRRAGAAGAGIVALPLGILRPAARHSRQPAGYPHRRRPLRVPVGSVLRHRTGLLLPEGRAELDKLATALIDLDKQIPSEIAWVLRVDGHTDVRPIINSPLFKSNWELSSARAISVVQYLVSLGVPAQRLVAAGFAEFQPLDTAQTEEAYKRNRRIELKLTER